MNGCSGRYTYMLLCLSLKSCLALSRQPLARTESSQSNISCGFGVLNSHHYYYLMLPIIYIINGWTGATHSSLYHSTC
ncbi:hypothetical protein V8C43DRAFT_296226 [Trichoderma afarasin]